jgi:hypothetical protein
MSKDLFEHYFEPSQATLRPRAIDTILESYEFALIYGASERTLEEIIEILVEDLGYIVTAGCVLLALQERISKTKIINPSNEDTDDLVYDHGSYALEVEGPFSIHELLDRDAPMELQKRWFRHEVRKSLSAVSAHPDADQDIAYLLAGLLSTKFARTLSDDDPHMQIMCLAGILELPEKHRGNTTWEEVFELAETLPEDWPL